MEWKGVKRGTQVIRTNQDPNDKYTDGIVHKVIRKNGIITDVQVSFYRKDKVGCMNRTVSIDKLEIV
jgi:hypothetical protein